MRKFLTPIYAEAKDLLTCKWPAIMICMCFLMAIGSCASCMWRADNPIEEAIEEVIKEETGIELDLSPKFDEPTGKILYRW